MYPITDRILSGRSHADQIREFIGTGVEFVQLREKQLSDDQFFEDAKDALLLAHQNRIRILINDRVDIAMALGADGVHVGQHDLGPTKVRSLLGPKAIIGYSTHSLDQVDDAISEPVDYIAYGPVFSTSTKPDAELVVGVEELTWMPVDFLDRLVQFRIVF